MKRAFYIFFVFQVLASPSESQNRQLADSLFEQEAYKEAAEAYQAIIRESDPHPETSLGTAYMRYGVCQMQLGKYQFAVPPLLKARDIFEQLGNQERIGTTYTNLANLYALQQNHDFAARYLDKAMVIFQALNDTLRIAEIMNDQAVIELDRNQITRAIAIHRQAIEQFQDQMPEVILAKHYYNLGTCYDHLNWDSSLYYYNKATEAARSMGDSSLLAVSFTNIGDIYRQQGNFSKALSYFEQSLALNRDYGDSADLSIIYHNLSEVYDSMKDYRRAYLYAIKERGINEWLYNTEKSRFASELSEKYESDKKDNVIRAKETENRLQSRNLVIALLGLFIAGLMTVLIFFQYRQKKKSNSILSETNHKIGKLNKELEASNEVKAKLFSIISHDIRGPVSSLYAYLQMQANEGRVDKMLSTEVTRQTGQLLETLEDLLIWSKSQMNQFQPSIETVNLQEIFRELHSMYDVDIKRSALSVSLEVPGGLLLETDRMMLLIILRNLYSNALRNTQPSSVILCRAEQLGENDIRIIIQNDTNYSADTQRRILQYNPGRMERSGYGLILVREFLQILQGDLTYDVSGQRVTAFLKMPVNLIDKESHS